MLLQLLLSKFHSLGIQPADIFHFPGCHVLFSGCRRLLQTSGNSFHIPIAHAVSADTARIKHTDGSHCADSLVRLGSLDGVAAAPADAQGANPAGVHACHCAQVIDCRADILHPVGGTVRLAGNAAAGALVSRVKGNGNIAVFRKALGEQSGYLLLHASIGMGHHDSRVGAVLIVSGREIKVGRQIDALLILIRNRTDVYLSLHILRDGSVVNQSKGIVCQNLLHGGLNLADFLLGQAGVNFRVHRGSRLGAVLRIRLRLCRRGLLGCRSLPGHCGLLSRRGLGGGCGCPGISRLFLILFPFFLLLDFQLHLSLSSAVLFRLKDGVVYGGIGV